MLSVRCSNSSQSQNLSCDNPSNHPDANAPCGKREERPGCDWIPPLLLSLLLALLSLPASAVEWYVAPDATREGTGTIGNPWSLQTAIDRVTPVAPGDVLWLRGGTYQSNYFSYLTGAPDRYITVRGYPNERVLFDGSPMHPTSFPLTIEGEWTIYRDFEVTHSVTWTDTLTPVAINCIGPNVKLVNLVIHDAGQGVGFWKEAVNSEIYGSIIYNNGHDIQEHGIYTQNDVGTKQIRDCIIFHNSGYAIHAYAQNGYSRGYLFEGNILFNNGFDTGELFVGSFHPGDRINILNNYSFAHNALTAPVFSLNDRNHSNNPNGSAVVQGNYLVGGSGFSAQDFTDISFSNNLVVSLYQLTLCRPPPGIPLSSYQWDDNTYFGLSSHGVGPTLYDLPAWQTVSSLDQHSTHQPALPSGTQTFIRPNLFEAKRAHIAVYNWDLADNVSVDLNSILSVGDRYEVRNAQDYFGHPVLTNIFNGNPIALPMTNLSVALPGRPPAARQHTGPLFAAFVVSISYSPPSELIARWPLDDSTGTAAQDVAGQNTGAFGDQPTWSTGKFGGALHFDGTNDFLTVPDAPSLNLTNEFSISLWFNPSQTVDENSPRQDILTKFLSYWILLNFPFQDGRLAFTLNDGSQFVLRSIRNSWEPNHWYHVVATFNGTEMRLYLDGQLQDYRASTYRSNPSPYPLELGGNSTQQIFFAGGIDEVRLYNYALAPTQILDLFHATPPTNSPPVIKPLSNLILPEGETIFLYNLATDPDLPPDDLTFSLEPGAPNGARVNAFGGGVFVWSPGEAQGPSTNLITIRVTDNGSPNLSATQSFTLIITEVPTAPLLPSIPDQLVVQGQPLTLNFSAFDPDLPSSPLRYTLDHSSPINPSLNPDTGLFSWTPSQPSGPHPITIRVTELDPPHLTHTVSFTLTSVARPSLAPLRTIDGQLVLSWNALPGVTYRVRYKNSLVDPAWHPLPGDILADTLIATKTDPMLPSSRRFYEVMVLPPGP